MFPYGVSNALFRSVLKLLHPKHLYLTNTSNIFPPNLALCDFTYFLFLPRAKISFPLLPPFLFSPSFPPSLPSSLLPSPLFPPILRFYLSLFFLLDSSFSPCLFSLSILLLPHSPLSFSIALPLLLFSLLLLLPFYPFQCLPSLFYPAFLHSSAYNVFSPSLSRLSRFSITLFSCSFFLFMSNLLPFLLTLSLLFSFSFFFAPSFALLYSLFFFSSR